MNSKIKTILAVTIVTVFGFIIFGLYLMSEEDRYGDLVYFNQKVKDGDIIFRCKYSGDLGQTSNFNEFGIIEKSWGNVYVWDNQNTIKKDLYDWAEKGNGERVKVYRTKDSDFEINKAELVNGTYNYLMESNKMEFVTENY
ncbi:hypothetical protein [Gelatiniphilus marinus]|uniref:Uncharacterized protein n=1 Tax=Gelatiniphilus marinus TaxID=1759464 RepID=A0ABW5JV69_9FLAO